MNDKSICCDIQIPDQEIPSIIPMFCPELILLFLTTGPEIPSLTDIHCEIQNRESSFLSYG